MKIVDKLARDKANDPGDYILAIREGKTVYIHKQVRMRNNLKKKAEKEKNLHKTLELELLKAEQLEDKLKDDNKLFEHFMVDFTEKG